MNRLNKTTIKDTITPNFNELNNSLEAAFNTSDMVEKDSVFNTRLSNGNMTEINKTEIANIREIYLNFPRFMTLIPLHCEDTPVLSFLPSI
jgi:hypothetical protein